MIPQLATRKVALIVVSGDMIEGTITPKLLNRTNRGLIEFRREQAGRLPTVEEFGQNNLTPRRERSGPGSLPSRLGVRLFLPGSILPGGMLSDHLERSSGKRFSWFDAMPRRSAGGMR